MEKMRPPGVTELLLTSDGDHHILEGAVTNFFVVCQQASPTSFLSMNGGIHVAVFTDNMQEESFCTDTYHLY